MRMYLYAIHGHCRKTDLGALKDVFLKQACELASNSVLFFVRDILLLKIIIFSPFRIITLYSGYIYK